ncbi:MAG: peptidoglycan-binding domain-containing protein [Microbacterium sp.]
MGAAWVAAIAIAVVAFPLSRDAERLSIEPVDPVLVSVGSRETDLPRAVIVSVVRSKAPEVRVASEGLVTQVYLRAGDTIQNGKPIIAVNGTDVLAQVTERPFWRDLTSGDKGQDVADLSEYLVSLGLLNSASSGDTFGPSTYDAVTELQRILGVYRDGVFRRSYVAFVPGDQVSEVIVRPGDFIDSQTSVATLASSITQITMRGQEGIDLSEVADSPIVMQRGEVEIELPSSTVPAESFDAVADLFATASPLTGDADDIQEFDGAVVRLRDPIIVGTVPSSAIYVDSEGKTCVFAQPSESESSDDWEPEEAMLDTPSTEIGIVYVQRSLSGRQVLSNPAAKLGTSRQCE